MMDRAVQEECLALLGACHGTKKEYMDGLRKVKQACRASFSKPRYACYRKNLDEVISSVSALSNKAFIRAGKEGMAPCRETLDRIARDLEQEEEIKKVVVFLPCEAAMWDSMEGIWRAAREDEEQCSVYVIPLVYYSLDSDRKPIQAYNERLRFPSYVSTLDVEEVNLKELRPDIIFINNQYDYTNLVTTIHPDYYSEKLKQVTPLLVLLDYGVPLWVVRDTGRLSVSKDTFMFPAQWNADVEIACTKELADQCRYTAEKIKADRNEPMGGEDKFVALGSSKFDCLLKATRENHPIPSEWRKKVGEKKVLLYNTTLPDMGEEAYLETIQKTIETMRGREDAVLWWRPHPLAKYTVKALHPDLEEAYDKIVKLFRESGTGIYDDTADFHRAIAWSDGCLSGESSVAWLLLAAGKPFSIFSPDKLLPDPIHDDGNTFHKPLACRLANMRMDRGANPRPEKWNYCIWWDNFLTEDVIHNIHYDHFLERFLHFIVHPEEYPEAEEYRELQLKMFRSFIVNPDGSAGEKIYRYCLDRLSRLQR